ncbi:MAG: penicillin acylase family protein [Aeoliella sp.]
MTHLNNFVRSVLFIFCFHVALASSACADDPRKIDNAKALASRVTIHRDAWGVPHIFGDDDVATCFGMGYAQAEDYFWQLEDNCIRAAGRYAEVVGEAGLKSDLLNRVFEIPSRSQEDLQRLDAKIQHILRGYVAGINFYLQCHPEVKPRLLDQVEPWHPIAIDRHLILDFVYDRLQLARPQPGTIEEAVQAATGSNGWAIAASKTKSGNAMLLINPHQPWYGPQQFYESHVHSDEGMNFSGACFFGNPIPTLGFNEHLGWAYTVNEPDIADSYRIVFDDPNQPLNYRYDGGYRLATEWTEKIGVKRGGRVVERKVQFRKTHHGPVVHFEDDQTALAIRVARLFDIGRIAQAGEMIRARNFEQWRRAVSRCGLPMFNIAYADREGNIFYAYNGAIPIRDPNFDWTRPVDGSDPRTEWKGYFAFDDLPQVLNPPSGYVQNCNSTPFKTTDEGNPDREDYPAYMMQDGQLDKRRAKMSRKILREAEGLTFNRLQELAFDTTLYWPLTELPKFKAELSKLENTNQSKAARVKPYLDHLLDWDCRVTESSTQATLCEAWYAELFGEGYPAETLRAEYAGDRASRLEGLVKAAKILEHIHGDWKVPWGDVHRVQRFCKRASVLHAGMSFNDLYASLPCCGAPGPMGVVFTAYSTPSIRWVRPKRYLVVGASYLSAVEFGERVRAATVTPLGQVANPGSPHYLDQAQLMTSHKLKPGWLYPDEVIAGARHSYHPGEN